LSKLILPRQYAQMATPIVFWYSKKLDHILNPPSPFVPAPLGYERIECRHAHEVETWSARLRAQEKRLRDMTEEERYNFEEPIRSHMLQELRDLHQKATTPANKEFLAVCIQMILAKRERRKKEVTETFMHVEAKEGLAP